MLNVYRKAQFTIEMFEINKLYAYGKSGLDIFLKIQSEMILSSEFHLRVLIKEKKCPFSKFVGFVLQNFMHISQNIGKNVGFYLHCLQKVFLEMLLYGVKLP